MLTIVETGKILIAKIKSRNFVKLVGHQNLLLQMLFCFQVLLAPRGKVREKLYTEGIATSAEEISDDMSEIPSEKSSPQSSNKN